MCVCVLCVCMYICMYVYTHTHTRFNTVIINVYIQLLQFAAVFCLFCFVVLSGFPSLLIFY